MSNKPIILFLCGIPASGKSTFAKSFKENQEKKGKKVIYISRDEIRYSILKPKDSYFEHEDEVLNIFYKAIDNETRNEENDYVIIDATHLTPNSRRIPLSYIYKECAVKVIYFTTALETCLKRNSKRKGRAKVPEEQIKKMNYSFKYFSEKERQIFNNISFIEKDENGWKKVSKEEADNKFVGW